MKRELLVFGLVAALMASPVGIAGAADQVASPGTPAPKTFLEKTSPRIGLKPVPRPKYEDFGARVPGGMQKGTAIDGRNLAAEELWGQTVYDLKNREVGTVKDVAEAVGEGRQAIVEVGRIFGFGGKDVAVPVRHFRLQPDGRLVVTLTEAELKDMPEVRTRDSSAS